MLKLKSSVEQAVCVTLLLATSAVADAREYVRSKTSHILIDPTTDIDALPSYQAAVPQLYLNGDGPEDTVQVMSQGRRDTQDLLAKTEHSAVMKSHHGIAHINHLYGDHGEHVFSQIIFEYVDECGNLEVQAWRMIDSSTHHPERRPIYDHRRKVWRSIWHDKGTLRDTTFDFLRETWTHEDPEVKAREDTPEKERKELPLPFIKEKKKKRGRR